MSSKSVGVQRVAERDNLLLIRFVSIRNNCFIHTTNSKRNRLIDKRQANTILVLLALIICREYIMRYFNDLTVYKNIYIYIENLSYI